MNHENDKLPGGVEFSSITYEDIRWQTGVFRYDRARSGEDKKYVYWNTVKTKLGEIKEKHWCRLAEALIERENETQLLKDLIQWCTEHNYVKASAAEIRKEALQLHVARSFDDPQWVGFVPFNKKYRPEVLETANIVFVRNECCQKVGPVTQEQIDRSHAGTIACPYCGRWSGFIVLGTRLRPEPLDSCWDCDCNDPDIGCAMPSIDKSCACPLGGTDDEQMEVLDG